MKAFRCLQVLALACVIIAIPAARAEQGSIVGPTAGPKTMAEVMALINAGLLAIQSCNSGGSAPANGPNGDPVQYQCWADTSSDPVVYKYFDGVSWVAFGKLDAASHEWTPVYQGADLGTASIQNMGASGHMVPFLDAANTWSGVQSFNSGDLSLKGSSSGAGTLNAPAAASSYVWTMPAATGTIAYLGNKLSSFAATTSTELAGVISDESGTGALVFANAPTLVTPNLGTPSAATLTNATGLPVSTGISGLGSGIASWLGTPSSANLAAAVTNETGSGALVFGTSPNITTPTGIVKGDVGLGNVDNTSDATKNAAAVTLANKTINGANNSLTVLAGSQLSGQVPVANGGTGSTSISSALDTAFSSTQGTILYRGASGWNALVPGTAGEFLTTQGSGANPNWSGGGAGTGTVTSVSAGTGMSFSTITASGSVAIDKATAANFTGNTSNKVLTPDGVWGAASLVSATITTSYTPDFSAGTNFLLTTTSATNFTLNNPINAKPGQTGCIYFSQSSGTPSSITFGTNWLTPGGKSALNLAQVATALNRLCYFVVASSVIDFTLEPRYLQ